MISLLSQLHSTFNLALYSLCTQLNIALFCTHKTHTFSSDVVELKMTFYFKCMMLDATLLYLCAIDGEYCKAAIVVIQELFRNWFPL